MNIVDILQLYLYTDLEYENEKTIIILESGRFFFLSSVVSSMYIPGAALKIKNREGGYSYSKVKKIYNLKEKELNKILHMYGKEWISGQGYVTESAEYDYKYHPDKVKNNLDFIPKHSDCPQKGVKNEQS